MTEAPSKGVKIHRVILIDDEKSVLHALKLLLEALGYTVREFSDPESAITYVSDSPEADVILCDLRMPKLTGLEVLAKCKAANPELPFVLMSGHAGDDEIETATRLGAFGFLAKPFTPDQLAEVVARLEDARGT